MVSSQGLGPGGAGSLPHPSWCPAGSKEGRVGGLGSTCPTLLCPRLTPLLPLCTLQSEERSVLFAVASALVNCTNSYDYEEPDPKMVELAKYAKQHVPEQHPKVRKPPRGHGGLCGFQTPDLGHLQQPPVHQFVP